MKRIIILFVTAMLFIFSCGGIKDLSDKMDEKGEPVKDNPVTDNPVVVPAPYKIVVGDNSPGGYIYISEDGGETWTRGSFPLSNGWAAVKSTPDGLKLVAAPVSISGDSSTQMYLYTSVDGGYTWQGNNVDALGHNWVDVALSDDGSKMAATDNYVSVWSPQPTTGAIFSSIVSGFTWSQDFGINFFWGQIALSSDGSRGAAVVSGSELSYIYVNNGGVWVAMGGIDGSFLHYFSCVATSSDGMKLVIGSANAGYIFTSTDVGVTWTKRTGAGGGSSKYWVSVASSSDGMKLAAAEISSGYIWTSGDGGVNWTQHSAAGSRSWIKIASSPDGKFLAAGVNGGFIYTSSDGGITWIERTGIFDAYGAMVTASGIAVTAK